MWTVKINGPVRLDAYINILQSLRLSWLAQLHKNIFCSHVPPSHRWGRFLMSQGQLICNWRVPVQYVVYRPVWAGFGWVKGNSPDIDWYGGTTQVGMRHRRQLVQLVRHWPKMLLKPSFASFFKAPWSEVWRGFDSSLRFSAFSSYLSFFVLTIKSPTFLSRSALTQYRRVCPNRSISLRGWQCLIQTRVAIIFYFVEG